MRDITPSRLEGLQDRIVVMPLDNLSRMPVWKLCRKAKGTHDLESGLRTWDSLHCCGQLPIFLYRTYLGGLLILLIFLCSYGLLSMRLDIMDGGRLAHCGAVRKYHIESNRTALDFVSFVRVRDRSVLRELQNMDRDYVLMDIWGDLSDHTDAVIKLTFRFLNTSNASEGRIRESNRPHLSSRSKRSVEDDDNSSRLDDLAAYEDDYPVNLDMTVDKKNDESDKEELDVPLSGIVNATTDSPSDQIYAVKCKDWMLQQQQKQLFFATNREVTKIREKMEEALKGTSASQVQLDVKNMNGRHELSESAANRLLVQKTIFNVLSRFSGAAEGEEENAALDDDPPLWAREWN